MIELLIESLIEYARNYAFPISLCFLITAGWGYYHLFSSPLKRMDVPSIDGKDGPYGKEFCTSIMEGTALYRNSIFKLNTSNHETVVLPARYIDELKSMPETNISLGMELYERQLGKYTLIGTVGRAHGFVNSIRMDLNRNLVATLELLLAEVEYTVGNSIGHCPDWKPIAVYSGALRMVALLTGRTFVGSALSRNEEWINSSIQTTVDTFTAAFKLWTFHWALRPIMAYFMPEIHNIHKQIGKTTQLLEPILKERLKRMSCPDFKPPVDMLQFFLDNLPDRDPVYQAKLQSAINVAAIHTTSMNVTQVLYDLAAYPSHIQLLRDEMTQVLAESNGVIDKNALTKLRKLDSFLRESQRLSPPGVVSMSRKVESNTFLSDGTLLPKGSLVACDSWSATRDPSLWTDPDSFDGFRFEKLRSIPGNEAKYQFVTSSPKNMPFGHGAHACPGRFFVANEVKILISHILQRYDLKLKPGCQRPQSTYNNIMILPDMEAEIMFRSRL